jgi:hypothetical protein
LYLDQPTTSAATWNAPNNINFTTQTVMVESQLSQTRDQDFGPMESF